MTFVLRQHQTQYGIGAAFLFALALVCAGQTASVTATLAGQIVSEGFILWNISVCVLHLEDFTLALPPFLHSHLFAVFSHV
jgi:metal iron transporter